MKISKFIAAAALAIIAASGLSACAAQSDTVSHNLSKDADSFKVNRLVIFHNDVTDTDIWTIEGRCALGNDDSGDQTTVICKIGEDKYVKEIIRRGDNVSVMAIQTEPSSSDPYHYTVLIRPEVIVPNLEVQTSGG